jgi:hypothetical protein
MASQVEAWAKSPGYRGSWLTLRDNGRGRQYHPIMADGSEGDRLYGLSLEEFTPARDALAARMRSAGDAEESKRIKALRKPSTPAWAVNQLARRQAPLVDELIAASERLRRTQQELLAGGSAQAVWEATLTERELLSRLVHEAERILEGQGYGSTRATLDRISDTLAAAAADPVAQQTLRRGVLTAEMRRAGFGDILGGSAEAKPRVAGSKRPDKKPAPAKSTSRPAGPSSKAMLDAEREAVRLDREAARAEEDAERLERAAERAADAVEAARKRLQIVDKESSKARAEAAEAVKRARAARRKAEQAAEHSAKLGKR